MRKTIVLELTERQAVAVSRGLRAALDFMDTYYMFGYSGDRNYNKGSLSREKILAKEAKKVISVLEGIAQCER